MLKLKCKVKSLPVLLVLNFITPYALAGDATLPCDEEGNQCVSVWNSNDAWDTESNFYNTLKLYDHHDKSVHCDPGESVEYDTDSAGNKALTVKFTRDVDGGDKNTCYAKITDRLPSVSRGYLTAKVKKTSISGTPNDEWGAFWLTGTHWPTHGEIDISEMRWTDTISALHGGDTEGSYDWSLSKHSPNFENHGIADNNVHELGLSWEIQNDQIIIKTYDNGNEVFTGTSDATGSGQITLDGDKYGGDSVYRQIATGFLNGKMSMVLDAVSLPSADRALSFNMQLSDVNIYKVNNPINISMDTTVLSNPNDTFIMNCESDFAEDTFSKAFNSMFGLDDSNALNVNTSTSASCYIYKQNPVARIGTRSEAFNVTKDNNGVITLNSSTSSLDLPAISLNVEVTNSEIIITSMTQTEYF